MSEPRTPPFLSQHLPVKDRCCCFCRRIDNGCGNNGNRVNNTTECSHCQGSNQTGGEVLDRRGCCPSATEKPNIIRRPSHDLFECIEQSENKRLSEEQARYVFAQVIETVCYLDSLGITHRDIKDENLVIDHNLKVRWPFVSILEYTL